ncbi:MAG: LPS-assembly protein LptD [Rhodospirillales bacterium]|nr:LPS-assembly protein LptD [Rhodospirillales bacterium]
MSTFSVMRKTNKPLLLLLGILAFAPCLALAAASGGNTPPISEMEVNDPSQEVRFSADEMQHDRELDIVTARGNVQVQQLQRILRADVIVYNRKQDFVTASGNVTLLEPSGDVLFAEFMELSGDLREGVIADLRAILKDGSLIAASGAKRTGANILNMRNAVYSPCRLCEDDPSRPPLWQVKAVKVIHDKKRQTIEYSDAWLEVAGMPVLYTPYLSHPDPTVKRKSGFLTPSFGSSTTTGSFLTTPYFFNIAPNADATLTPSFTADDGVILAGEYRHKFQEGNFEAHASIKENTPDSQQTYSTEEGIANIRGHISAKGRFDYDETWRWGFDANRQTDAAYMSRYGFTADNTRPEISNALASQGFVEGFRGRNYFYAGGTTFQNTLTNPDDTQTPLILPLVDFNHVGDPDRYGGHSTLDVNMLALSRSEGTDTRRLSFRGGWNLPHVAPKGDVYTLSAKMMGDFYHTNNHVVSGQDKTSDFAYRLMPQVALDWRYPFVRGEGKVYQMFEPIASAVVSPYGGNSSDIPNEDSQNLEFDDTNLFSDNRFSGLDRVEGGPRVNYGFKWGVFGEGGGSTSLLVGQSYRYKTDDTFATGSGLEDNFSDIVGRVHASPGSMLDIFYRTRLNKSNLEARRNEVDLSAGAPALRLSTRYSYFDRQEGSEFSGREEISGSLSSQLNKSWRSSLSATRDLNENDLRAMNLNLTYEDECFLLSTNINRTFFQNQELHPENSIVFRILFKTLGEVSPGVQVLNPNQTN